MSQILARHAAHAAYAAAIAAPGSADWRGLADTLFAALPSLPRATVESGLPAWWAEYDLPRAYHSESIDFLFADGETVRCEIHKAPRGLPRVPAACRAAIGFYRSRTGAEAVPEFTRIITMQTGQVFDASECSRLTAAARAVPGTVRGRVVTSESLARMEAELDRRCAGLSRMLKGDHVFSSAPLNAWRMAVVEGTRELEAMRDLFEIQRAGAASPADLVGFRKAKTEQAVAAWCEAVADDYVAAAEFELSGTFEAVADLATCEVAHNRKLTPHACLVHPVSDPVATYLDGVGPDNFEPTWEPTSATHPVIAPALSHKAREALFETLQDGTFPDDCRKAVGGAWRLTLADALACQDIASVRFVGMPRKAYTRRTSPPAAPVTIAVAMPPEFASGAYYPAPYAFDRAIVHHAANAL